MAHIMYTATSTLGHFDWGGTIETFNEIKNRGHRVSILSGESVKEYIESKGFDFYDLGMKPFKSPNGYQQIPEILKDHQINNFFKIDDLKEQYLKALKFVENEIVDIIIGGPLNKLGPMLSAKTKKPFVTFGLHTYEPEGIVKQDNDKASLKFEAEFMNLVSELEIPIKKPLGLFQSSELLNIFFSTPEFDQELVEPNITHVGADPILKNEIKHKKPKVYYSSGTIFWDANQVKEICSLVDECNIELHMTKSKLIPNEFIDNKIITYDFVDEEELIKNMDLMIIQGGLGTASKAFRSATPVILMPLFYFNYPQSIKTDRWGNGISTVNLNFSTLKDEVKNLLSNPLFKKRAEELQTNLASHGGSKKAADLILDLL